MKQPNYDYGWAKHLPLVADKLDGFLDAIDMSTPQMAKPDERRHQSRLQGDEKMLLKITRCEQDESLLGISLQCSAVDVSASGVKLRSSESAIGPGIELDMWIDIDGWASRYFLSGKVKWSMPAEGGHCAGVQLLELDSTDIRDWQALFS